MNTLQTIHTPVLGAIALDRRVTRPDACPPAGEGTLVVRPAAPLLAVSAWDAAGPALVVGGVAVAILMIVFVAVPIFKGFGMLIGGLFRGIAWLVVHLFTFVRGMIADSVRAVGAILTSVLFVPLILGNVVIGRWSASAHYGRAVKDEFKAFWHCLYRVAIGHPLRLLLLGGLTEGLEQRVPQAMQQAPGADRPSARVGTFDGYTIVGSLAAGGSGGKLYIAEPSKSKAAALARSSGREPGQVVIKSFSLRDGSTMPQIVRESRALEAARRLGLILDHELNDDRFYYVMPYVPGDSLAVVTRRLHAESGTDGLGPAQLGAALSHTADLLSELGYYHAGGLWHKDVKPDNIIVAGGKAHLVDLGLVTPLRSAMTLTTHGTEYFRDPELVRMALRGAKVNEVDGVKFDVYGAGAVLYSVIENSFPAHGALSQITRRCPEALRWVIRRSMAEMSQRYSSAGQMLADVRCIAEAPDPYSLRPIDLPSMKSGGDVLPADLEPRIEPAVFARTTPPPVPVGAGPGVAAHAKPEKDGFIFHAEFGLGNKPSQGRQAPVRKRPTILVTDWWRGRYRVAGEAADAGGDIFTQTRAGTRRTPDARIPRGPGRTAAEQLAAARQRVQAAQARLASRPRGRAGVAPLARSYSNTPNSGVIFAVLLLFGALVFALTRGNSGASRATSAGVESGFTVDLDVPGGDGVFVNDTLPVSLPGTPDVHAVDVGAHDDPGAAHRDSAKSVERRLDEAVQDFDNRISALRAKGPVTFRKYGEALGQSMQSWWNSGAGSYRRGAKAARNDGAPAPIAAPSEPGCWKPARVLVVSFLPLEPRDERHARLALIAERLKIGGYCVDGLSLSGDETDLVASAKSIIGLSGPHDPDAVGRLQAWMDSQAAIGAVLWTPQDPDARPLLLRSSALDQQSRAELTDAISGAR